MTILHIFTEETSICKVFETILPKILPPEVYFRVYPHQGKKDLERALTTTLPSISRIPGSIILVTRDQDSEDCKDLKDRLINLINNRCACDFNIRVICKELESWFLGDLKAVEKAFPRLKSNNYENKADLRNVDLITKPSNYLLKIIPEYSERESLPKIETAERIAEHLNLQNNRSSSFNHVFGAIIKLTEGPIV